jgi:hypothetical protein
MVEPADFRSHHDPTGVGRVDGARLGRVLLERKVRPRVLVVRHIAAKQASEMPLIDDDEVVQALAAD